MLSNQMKKDPQNLVHSDSLSSGVSSVSPVANGFIMPVCDIDYTQSLLSLQQSITDSFYSHKKQSVYLSSVYSSMNELKKANRVSSCGSYLVFHVYEDSAKLAKANFCRDRLCPLCNWRKSLKSFSSLSKVMNVLQSEGYQFIFLTFTIRNIPGSELSSAIDQLLSGWRFLSNKNSRFKSAIAGSFRSLEITYNKTTKCYHPHLHVVLAVSDSYFSDFYITQREWIQLWRSSAKLDYDPVVNVQKVKSLDNSGIGKGVAEVTKYAVKSSDFLTGDLKSDCIIVSDLLGALHHRRLTSMTGCFLRVARMLNVPDPEVDPLDDSDELRSDLQYMVIRYHWKNGAYSQI